MLNAILTLPFFSSSSIILFPPQPFTTKPTSLTPSTRSVVTSSWPRRWVTRRLSIGNSRSPSGSPREMRKTLPRPNASRTETRRDIEKCRLGNAKNFNAFNRRELVFELLARDSSSVIFATELEKAMFSPVCSSDDSPYIR